MENTDKRFLELRVSYENAVRGIDEYRKEIIDLTAKERELKKAKQDGKITDESYLKQILETKRGITQAKDGVKALEKEFRNNVKIEKNLEGSLASLRAQLSNLTSTYDHLGRAEREGAKGKELEEKIKRVQSELKGAEETTGRFQRSIGSYKDAVTEAAKETGILSAVTSKFSFAMQPINSLLSGIAKDVSSISKSYKEGATSANLLSGSQKAAAVSSNLLSTGLKLLRVALISTGIGAIVVALGSLVAYLTKTQEGTEKLSVWMSQLGAVVDVIVDRLAAFAGAMVKLFSGDFKGAASDAKAAFSGIGDEMSREVKLAGELKEASIQLEKEQLMLNAQKAASRAEFERLKKASDDVTKSTAERAEAAKKAYDIENNTLQKEIKLREKQLANMLGLTEVTDEARELFQQLSDGAIEADEVISQLGLSNSTTSDLKEFVSAFTELEGKKQESTTKLTEMQNKTNSLYKESADRAKEAKEKELEALRAAEDAALALLKESGEKQRRVINLNYDRQIEDLKKKLATEKNLTRTAKEKINEQINALDQKRLQDLQKVSDEELIKEADKQAKIIELKLSAIKKGTDAELALKLEQIELQKQAELRAAEEAGIEKVLIEQKYTAQADELRKQSAETARQKQADEIRLDFENKINEAKLNSENFLLVELEQRRLELESLQQFEEESDAQFKARQLAAQQAYTDSKEAIINQEIQIEQAKYQAAAQITGALSGLLETIGESNKAAAIMSKVVAMAEVAINTGKAIAIGVAEAQKLGFPANIPAVAATVTAILANMATATKTIKSAKFATGGLVTGSGTGTSDSIPARLSVGEAVMTARTTEMFSPILSMFNQMGGGVPIQAVETTQQVIGEDMLSRAFAKGVSSMPSPVVSVKDITEVTSRVNVIDNISKL